MRYQIAILLVVALVGAAPTARADPGLGSLEGLLPLWIAAFVILMIVFYGLPAWLTLRARKLHAKSQLTQTTLLLLVSPAALVGGFGIIDFFGPFGFVSATVHGITGGFGAYWIFLALNLFLVYLSGSAYRQCKMPPGGP